MIDGPTAYDAQLYMEIVAALITASGDTEIEINVKDVPDKPFQLWRRVEGDTLVVRLIWEEGHERQ